MTDKGINHISESPLLLAFFGDHMDSMFENTDLKVINYKVVMEILKWLNTLTDRELCYVSIIAYLLRNEK